MDISYDIIFVDDEQSVLNGIRRNLREHLGSGCSASFFQDGSSALSAIEKCPPDILVTDMRMPYMTGNELLSIVHQRFPSVQTFILSGLSLDSVTLDLIGSKEHYFSKPFKINSLLDAIGAPPVPKVMPTEITDGNEDALNIARGIVFGVLFAIPLWVMILLFIGFLLK